MNFLELIMGYLGNHLATVVCAVFAAVLSGLWYWFLGFAPVLDIVFLMAVPIMWFLVFTCWIAQKSADYMHRHAPPHNEKKSLTSSSSSSITVQAYTSDGNLASASKIKEAKTELSDELNNLRDTVKLKDSEIDRLKQEISNLETLVQIESLKSELANLKMLASKRK